MGEASAILGFEIIRNDNSIILFEEHYVEKILRKFGHYDFKLLSISYDANFELDKIIVILSIKLNMPKLSRAYCI